MPSTPCNALNISTEGLTYFNGTATFSGVSEGASGTLLQSAGASTKPGYTTATYPSTAGTSGNVLTSNGTNFTSSAPSAGGLGIYGDGSDGAQTFDGMTTILGIVPSNSTYTLARDIFLSSSTINTGISIITNGFRIFCQGTLTNNGTIQWNGNSTTTNTAGAILSNAYSSINAGVTSSAAGTAGGAGNTGGGTHGVNAGSITATWGGVGGTGGAGGSGGGVGGTIIFSGPPETNYGSIRSIPQSILGWVTSQGGASEGITGYPPQGGTGGGGGGGDGSHTGGGGGGGAGVVLLVVKTFAGTGNIQAVGGNGGAANASSTNSGGGGGGAGGLVLITSNSVSSGAISGQTISVAGGTQGSGVGGSNGNPGGTGTIILVPN